MKKLRRGGANNKQLTHDPILSDPKQKANYTDPEELYEKQERIGKGSFGEVYKGYDLAGSKLNSRGVPYSPSQGSRRRQRRQWRLK